jgi:hypothetical protein
MAKSKKKGPARPPLQVRSGRGKGQTTLPKPAPATEGGPNRLQRKEEARRQREALQRKMGRRKAFRTVGIVVAVLILAVAVTGGIVLARSLSKSPLQEAGCGPVQTTPAYPGATDLDRTHIGQGSAVKTPPPLSSYPTVPPASGPHLPPGETLKEGVYDTPPNVYMGIHSLEHGAVEFWYAPTATPLDVGEISDFYSNSANNNHVIVAKYSYPDQGTAGELPAGKQMVMVAWHRLQVCTHASLKAAQEFVRFYRFPTGGPRPPDYRGVAPEAGAAI